MTGRRSALHWEVLRYSISELRAIASSYEQLAALSKRFHVNKNATLRMVRKELEFRANGVRGLLG